MRRDIEFTSGGETVRGWLYTPDAGDGPFPVVVMAGGWCYVKELVQPHVAQEFADTGLAAILFDYRNFGASDGARRQHIDPNAQIEDYRNAISFAETLDEVDSDRIGVWGLSYSGGHALILGATDPRVKCVSAQIPVVDGYRNMRRVHGTIGFRRFQQLLLDDRRARFATGEDGFLPTPRPIPLRRSQPGRSRRPTRPSSTSSSARPRPTRTAARSNPRNCSCPTTSARSCPACSTSRRR